MTTGNVFSVVTIDGPAASGKSSVARQLARQLDFSYVNSGALYRAVAWHANARQIPADDRDAILAQVRRSRFEFRLQNKESFILIDGIDLGPHLQEKAVNQTVSVISTIVEVREFIVAQLRNFVDWDNLVMEGRDIGSVVFPETPYKFYLDASPEVRLQRRAAQGPHDEISKRDRLDTSRTTSPLTIAPGAMLVDTSSLTIEGVVNKILEVLKSRKLPQAASFD
jgi:cytidylate kinase